MSGASDPIFIFSKPPIILAGSGITRRYTNGSPNWSELLERIAARMGIDSNRLISFENDAQIKCDKRIGHMPRLATELQLFLNDQFRNDRIQEKDLFNDREMSQYRKHIDAVKILAASEFIDLTLKDDATLKEELSYFKKLADIIPCVITLKSARVSNG